MSITKILKKLTGIVKGGRRIEAPKSAESSYTNVKELDVELPEGDREKKKRNWISAKYKK